MFLRVWGGGVENCPKLPEVSFYQKSEMSLITFNQKNFIFCQKYYSSKSFIVCSRRNSRFFPPTTRCDNLNVKRGCRGRCSRGRGLRNLRRNSLRPHNTSGRDQTLVRIGLPSNVDFLLLRHFSAISSCLDF